MFRPLVSRIITQKYLQSILNGNGETGSKYVQRYAKAVTSKESVILFNFIMYTKILYQVH